MKSYKEALEFLAGKKRRKIDHNTYVEMRDGEAIAVKLHDTDVVTYYAEGAIRVSSGGWRTVTTKDRINNHSPFRVWQYKGDWYANLFVEGPTYHFTDGMILTADGGLLYTEPVLPKVAGIA